MAKSIKELSEEMKHHLLKAREITAAAEKDDRFRLPPAGQGQVARCAVHRLPRVQGTARAGAQREVRREAAHPE
jgi:hypothetical protein